MSLTQKQFDVLVALTEGKLSQRELEETTGHSLGTINKVVKDLVAKEFVANGELIELTMMGKVILYQVILKGLPLVLLGIWIYSKREFAMASVKR